MGYFPPVLSVFARPVEQKTIPLGRTLQNILNQQIPSDEAGKNVVFRLLRGGSQAFASFGVVALMHRSPLVNIGEHQASQNAGQLRRFVVEAVTLEGKEVQVVGIDPYRS